jgi:hypothetical protein
MTIQVIGAGFGRTGTLSLKKALEELGFGPCYHMEEVFFNPWRVRGWLQACQGKPVDWDRMLRGYRATVDWPGATFYRQLVEHYPQAKVILTVRDPHGWYASAYDTIYSVMQRFPLNDSGRLLPVIPWLTTMLNCNIWEGTFHGRFEDRAYAIQIYQQHIETVQRTVPPERLLVYEVRQGWEPLCGFLEVPVPVGRPFPRVNDRSAFQRRVTMLTTGVYAGLGAASLAVILGMAGLLQRSFTRNRKEKGRA